MSHTLLPARGRLARLIIVCHLVLIAFIVFLYMTDSLLPEEFTPLVALLAPLTSLYAGTFFRNLTAEIRTGQPAAGAEAGFAQAGLVRWLIVAHFTAMLFLIAAKAVFNWLEFASMILLMGLVEMAFGSYMGAVLSAVFSPNEEKSGSN